MGTEGREGEGEERKRSFALTPYPTPSLLFFFLLRSLFAPFPQSKRLAGNTEANRGRVDTLKGNEKQFELAVGGSSYRDRLNIRFATFNNW